MKRVEVLLDPSFPINLKILLDQRNGGKSGDHFLAPHAFVTFFTKLGTAYNIPFRFLKGISKTLSRITGIRSVCNTNIFMRIRKIVSQLPYTSGKPVDCIINSSGLNINIRSDYLRDK